MMMVFFRQEQKKWWTPVIWNYLLFDIAMEDCPVINKTYIIYIYDLPIKICKMVIFHYHWLVLQPIGVLGIPGRWWWPGILALTMEWPPCSTSICVIFWGVNPHFCGWMMLDVSMVYLSKKKIGLSNHHFFGLWRGPLKSEQNLFKLAIKMVPGHGRRSILKSARPVPVRIPSWSATSLCLVQIVGVPQSNAKSLGPWGFLMGDPPVPMVVVASPKSWSHESMTCIICG